jgi:hypothetical protein
MFLGGAFDNLVRKKSGGYFFLLPDGRVLIPKNIGNLLTIENQLETGIGLYCSLCSNGKNWGHCLKIHKNIDTIGVRIGKIIKPSVVNMTVVLIQKISDDQTLISPKPLIISYEKIIGVGKLKDITKIPNFEKWPF